MTWEWLEQIFGSNLRKFLLWLRDETKRQTAFFVLFLIITLVIGPKTIQVATNTCFLCVLSTFAEFVYKISVTQEYILTLTVVLILVIWAVMLMRSRIVEKAIEVNPEKEPGMWSYYKGSSWSLVEDNDCPGKVLKITNSFYPAILKFGNDWIDYDLSFRVKVPSTMREGNRNFSFVVRAKDKANNVFLQCFPSGKIRPHLIADGTIIIDDENKVAFPTEYPLDKWFDVSVKVSDDEITASIMGVSATYKIPSERFVVSLGTTPTVISLSKVREMNLLAEKEIKTEPAGGEQTHVVLLNLDYEKGTIGFRESGEEVALFRKIEIDPRQPFS